jgi:hypothetical protein
LTKIIKNSVKCKKCGDEIESTFVNNLAVCECGEVAIAGACNELIRYNDVDEYYDTSILEVKFKKIGKGDYYEQRNKT